MHKYTVTIIGLGNIGMLYDYNKEDKTIYLSHVKSFLFHKGFIIRYLIDKDTDKLKMAKERYGENIIYLDSVDKIMTTTDVVVLASTPKVNKILFNRLKNNSNIKLFLLEKPFWDSEMDISNYEGISSKCYINYYRKSLPLIIELKKLIQKNELGKTLGVHVWYSKGLRNNGSHMIDLINYLYNSDYIKDTVIPIHSIVDYSEIDKSVTFSIKYKYQGHTFPVLFQVADERAFSLIEIDLVFEKSRYRIIEFGGKIELYKVISDPVFDGYSNLVFDRMLETDINKYGFFTCEMIYNILSGKERNHSSLIDEYKVFNVIDAVKNKMNYE